MKCFEIYVTVLSCKCQIQLCFTDIQLPHFRKTLHPEMKLLKFHTHILLVLGKVAWIEMKILIDSSSEIRVLFLCYCYIGWCGEKEACWHPVIYRASCELQGSTHAQWALIIFKASQHSQHAIPEVHKNVCWYEQKEAFRWEDWYPH